MASTRQRRSAPQCLRGRATHLTEAGRSSESPRSSANSPGPRSIRRRTDWHGLHCDWRAASRRSRRRPDRQGRVAHRCRARRSVPVSEYPIRLANVACVSLGLVWERCSTRALRARSSSRVQVVPSSASRRCRLRLLVAMYRATRSMVTRPSPSIASSAWCTWLDHVPSTRRGGDRVAAYRRSMSAITGSAVRSGRVKSAVRKVIRSVGAPKSTLRVPNASTK